MSVFKHSAFMIPALLLACMLGGCRVNPLTSGHSRHDGLAQRVSPLAHSTVNPPAESIRTVSYEAGLDGSEPEPIAGPGDSSSALSLQALEDMALAANPSIGEARAQVDAARGKWLQVGLPPNTHVGYSGQQLGSGGTAEQQGVFLGQEFVRGNKLQLNRAIAAQEVQQAEQLLAAQEQRVLTDVRLAFYRVLVAQRRIELADELLGVANRAIETAETLFQAQEVSRVDVMRARIELQAAQLARKNATNQHVAAWTNLKAVAGLESLPTQELQGDLERPVDEIDPQVVMDRLLRESPEMAAVLTGVDRARWAVDRAHAEPIPNLDLQAVIQGDNATGSSNANLQVSIPIPWRDRNQGAIRKAHADVIAAEFAVERLRARFEQRLAGVYQRYADARNQVNDYAKEDGILANSRMTLDFVGQAYQAGELNYLDLITAQRTFSETNLAYIDALGEMWAAIIELDGLLLKESLSER